MVGYTDIYFVENFVLSLSVKNLENRSIFREVIDMSRMSCFFESQCNYREDVFLIHSA